jgi:hypothetical protein
VPEPPNGQKFKHSNKRGRGGRKRPRRVAEQQPPASTVLFETFETRVLLDAVLPVNPVQNNSLPNGTILASDTQPGTVQDGDGTTVGVAITGNGHWQITQESLAPALTIFGTASSSVVSITTTGGDGRFLFSGIGVESPAASLTGTGVDLNGGLTLTGTINKLFLGDLTVDASSALTIGSKAADTVGALMIGETTLSTLAAVPRYRPERRSWATNRGPADPR